MTYTVQYSDKTMQMAEEYVGSKVMYKCKSTRFAKDYTPRLTRKHSTLPTLKRTFDMSYMHKLS